MSGIIALANAISDMGAMTSLDVSNNKLCAEGTKLLAEALKGNQIMTELSLSSNYVTEGGLSGVVALADAIPDMGALTNFDISDNGMRAGGCKAITGALKGNNTLTELNIAKTMMTYGSDWGNMSAVIALVDAIPDMRAMTSLSLATNSLGVEGAKIVAEAIKVRKCGCGRFGTTMVYI
jgi:Ran GTPase-activating protein (RanGAP) involved in mRNA processing and transport